VFNQKIHMCNSSSIKDQSGYKVTCSIINSTSKLQSLSTCATYLHLSTKIFFNLYNAYTMKTKKKNDWSIGRRKHAILGWAMSFKILAADRPLRSTHPVVITHQNLSAPNPNVKIRNHHVLLHTPNPYVQIRITTTISSPNPSHHQISKSWITIGCSPLHIPNRKNTGQSRPAKGRAAQGQRSRQEPTATQGQARTMPSAAWLPAYRVGRAGPGCHHEGPPSRSREQEL
jgi:hypothetical protein